MVCFFFKQKTAYEMRISDWSSDVCSSDLQQAGYDADQQAQVDADRPRAESVHRTQDQHHRELPAQEAAEHVAGFLRESRHGAEVVARHQRRGAFDEHVPVARSEEHTSELQSLMRNSYADFCLKKKKKNNTT